MSDLPFPENAQRLERGEILYFPESPFPLPSGEESALLRDQVLVGGRHKNICYDPQARTLSGLRPGSMAQSPAVQSALADFAARASTWLASAFPGYADGWRPDRVSFRPVEEATRKLRLTARNDLLHIDAFPTRPTHGYRILRLFANLDTTSPRVWITSDTFAALLGRFAADIGLPTRRMVRRNQRTSSWLSVLPGAQVLFPKLRHGAYDRFMLRLHHFLKGNEEFQQRARRRFWKFAPGSAWLVMTDGVSYAELRGRYALEHSFFIAPQRLALPDESPAALLEQRCGLSLIHPAA
jgi:hypothetical protein